MAGIQDRVFKVALSFPGERRAYVSQVAKALALELGKDAIFFDEWYRAELSLPNLDLHLQTIYGKAELVVPFLSADYERKQWCKLEWRAIREVIMQRPDESVMPLRFDDTRIPGLFDHDGYLDLRQLMPHEVAVNILRRLARPAPVAYRPRINTARLPAIQGQLFGREEELRLLDEAWCNPGIKVLCLTAWGGEGKSMLVQAWLQRLRRQKWAGAKAVFGWSFYSRNTSKEWRVSADQFFKDTLHWFGHEEDGVALPPWDKGEALARLVMSQCSLLVLDGLESLQESSGGKIGELREQGMKALLRTLSDCEWDGLCLITSRIPFREFHHESMVAYHSLGPLPLEAGIELLRNKGVKGQDEAFREVVESLRGHALSLTLFGNLLVELYGGDLSKRRRLPPIIKEDPAHSVMGFYEREFRGKPELLLLYLMGLSDRPLTLATLAVLLKPSRKKRWRGLWLRGSYEAVFAPLIKLDEPGRLKVLAHVKRLELLADALPSKADWKVDSKASDCHPLVHEYFGNRFREQWPSAWKQAHGRLYEFYRVLPEKEQPDSLDELEPLFAAVAHGCLAGKMQQAMDEVYVPRIRRHDASYLSTVLGAIPMSLAVLSNFFSKLWTEPSLELDEESRAKVLNWAGFRLRALGRLERAKEPLHICLNMHERWHDWDGAADTASNLSMLYLVLGDINEAEIYARTCVEYADRTASTIEHSIRRTTLADVYHQMGRLEEADGHFQQAEQFHRDIPGEDCPYLYGLWGFRHCDLLLTQGRWEEVLQRAEKAGKVNVDRQRLLDIGLNKLMVGSTYLEKYKSTDMQDAAAVAKARELIREATDDLRSSNENHHLPKGLLVRAQFHRLVGEHEKARQDLESVRKIASRRQGTMRLYLVDYHLESVRLALATSMPVEEHLQKAETLIAETGYGRRLPELYELKSLLGN